MPDYYRERASAGLGGVISRNPRETVGLFAATAAIVIIFVNALFLQPGPHPAPIFAHRAPVQAVALPQPVSLAAPPVAPVNAVPAPPVRPDVVHRPGKPVAAHEATRNDPIARLLAPSNRVVAVQRILTDYGYGQIRATGIVGPDTQEAIRRFERSRKMPVTGALSDTLVKALADMSGQPID